MKYVLLSTAILYVFWVWLLLCYCLISRRGLARVQLRGAIFLGPFRSFIPFFYETTFHLFREIFQIAPWRTGNQVFEPARYSCGGFGFNPK